jgi:hypothetical protein
MAMGVGELIQQPSISAVRLHEERRRALLLHVPGHA